MTQYKSIWMWIPQFIWKITRWNDDIKGNPPEAAAGCKTQSRWKTYRKANVQQWASICRNIVVKSSSYYSILILLKLIYSLHSLELFEQANNRNSIKLHIRIRPSLLIHTRNKWLIFNVVVRKCGRQRVPPATSKDADRRQGGGQDCRFSYGFATEG